MMKKQWYQRIAVMLSVFVAGVMWCGAVQHIEEVRNQEVAAEKLEENTELLGGMPIGILSEDRGGYGAVHGGIDRCGQKNL